MWHVVPGSLRRRADISAHACAALYVMRMSESGGTRSESCEACVYEPHADAVELLCGHNRRWDGLKAFWTWSAFMSCN
jgi:hypothetical protein